uniref:Uncharacterized protein n=1 Tax=Paramormyrops kingsleyae TaxID=1676925 RepID=A0A3B3QN95_9TELE
MTTRVGHRSFQGQGHRSFHGQGHRSLHGKGHRSFHGQGHRSFHGQGHRSFHGQGHRSFHGQGHRDGLKVHMCHVLQIVLDFCQIPERVSSVLLLMVSTGCCSLRCCWGELSSFKAACGVNAHFA